MLDPLNGYSLLAKICFSFENNKNYFTQLITLSCSQIKQKSIDLVQDIQKHLNFEVEIDTRNENLYESKLLSLSSEKALRDLQWEGLISFENAIKITVEWYKTYLENNNSALKSCIANIENFEKNLTLH